jgi:cbb3-type cytochrome oxidase subunit 3
MFSALLLIKQFQFLAGLFVSCQLFLMLDARTASRLLDIAMFILLVGAWYFYITHWWNLPLPYHEGSGAVMGAIVFLYTLWVMQTKSLKSPVVLLWLSFLLISGFMTMGRTQVLAFVVAMGVYMSGQMLVHNTPGRMLAIVSGIVAVAVAFYVVFYTDVLGVDFYGGNPLQYLNLKKLLDDPSFAIRYYIVWPYVFGEWTENPIVRFFFGFGLGRERYVDGLYINIIVSTGLLGVLTFTLLNIWLFLVLPRFRVVMVLLWISGLTGEILLHSYRFHQFLMVIGVMFFLYTPHARWRVSVPPAPSIRP